MQMILDCLPDDLGIAVSYPLPGTRFYEAVREQLGSKQNWVDSSDLDVMYQAPYPTAFYRTLHAVLHKELRIRKAKQALSRAVRRPRSLRRRHLRQAAALVQPYGHAALPAPSARADGYRGGAPGGSGGHPCRMKGGRAC